MPKNNLIPSIPVCIGKGIDALIALRPNALQFINYGTGNWSHIFAGWAAQGRLVAQRYADEAQSCRLFSSGDALDQLAASEFGASINTTPTNSIGEITLVRSTGGLPAGVIRIGTKFAKQEDPNALPLAIKGATYSSSQDIIVALNQTTVVVPFIADTTGPNGNSPSSNVVSGSITANTFIQPSVPLFDTNFTVQDSHAAGGSANPDSDTVVRKLATALWQGKYGPLMGAITAGALSFFGVANLAVIDNGSNAKTVIFPTDESWAYSAGLNNAVGQLVRNTRSGFGCIIQLGKTANQFIHIEATVQLFNSSDLIDTTDINNSVITSLKYYFDQRPDWWTWTLDGVQSAITSASRKIYACTTAVVKDASTNAVLSPPGVPVLDDNNPILQHYYLPENSVNITYQPPPS